jgi:hypothetical protein
MFTSWKELYCAGMFWVPTELARKIQADRGNARNNLGLKLKCSGTLRVARNYIAQLAVHGQQTAFRPQRCVPGLLIRSIGAIARSATVARNFAAHCRRSSMEATGDLTNRRAASHPSRDVFSFTESER